MEQVPTRLAGLIAIRPSAHTDPRGLFFESYRQDAYRELGIDAEFVQDNHSRSVRGTLRGLHFQLAPGQPKLVRAARGAVFDVVVDLRRGSPTFGEWESFRVDDQELLQLYIPIGFAHGFCVLSDVADFVYKVGSYYDAVTESGIAWDDPDLAIPWPFDDPLVSDRDRQNPRLRDIAAELPDWG